MPQNTSKQITIWLHSCVSSVPVVFVATPDPFLFFTSTRLTPPFPDAQVGGMPRCFDMPGAAKELRHFAAKQVLRKKDGPPKLKNEAMWKCSQVTIKLPHFDVLKIDTKCSGKIWNWMNTWDCFHILDVSPSYGVAVILYISYRADLMDSSKAIVLTLDFWTQAWLPRDTKRIFIQRCPETCGE